MLWRVEQPAHVLTLTGHLQGLSDAAWAPDGRYLCTASDDQTVRVFDCTTGQVLRTFRGHQSYVCCCAYSPRGNIIASGSYDETIKLWDVRTARCLRSFGSHSDPVTALDFSWDGSLLASSSFDGLCRVWDAIAGTCIKTLLVDDNPYAFVLLLPISLPPFLPCSPQRSFIVTIVCFTTTQDIRQVHAQQQVPPGIVFGQHAAAVVLRARTVSADVHGTHSSQVQRGGGVSVQQRDGRQLRGVRVGGRAHVRVGRRQRGAAGVLGRAHGACARGRLPPDAAACCHRRHGARQHCQAVVVEGGSAVTRGRQGRGA